MKKTYLPSIVCTSFLPHQSRTPQISSVIAHCCQSPCLPLLYKLCFFTIVIYSLNDVAHMLLLFLFPIVGIKFSAEQYLLLCGIIILQFNILQPLEGGFVPFVFIFLMLNVVVPIRIREYVASYLNHCSDV